MLHEVDAPVPLEAPAAPLEAPAAPLVLDVCVVLPPADDVLALLDADVLAPPIEEDASTD